MEIKNTLLAADVGGTKTIMCLTRFTDGDHHIIKTQRYVSCDFENFEALVKDFLKDLDERPKVAVFGIPGPVQNGMVKSTNLPWVIEEKKLREATGISKIQLVNDLTATAYSIPDLKSNELVSIKAGKRTKTPKRYVVIAPGTGLGQAFLICSEGKKIVIPSEGGHADFAATSALESELFQYMKQKFGHVSYERIISGIGIPNIFDFLIAKGAQPKSETLERMLYEKKGVVISEMALAQRDPVCEKALDIFVDVLGKHAGNLALSFLPDGGIYLAGGIPFKILSKIREQNFIDGFLKKGRMNEVVCDTPINVITNNEAAIKGATLMAYELSKE